MRHTVSNRLLELLKDQHITRTGLATRLNVTYGCVQQWCAGDTIPSMNSLVGLAKFFGPEDFYYLVTGERY